MSGNPTFFMKIGQSPLCTGSSTQIQNLYITCPKHQYHEYKQPLGPNTTLFINIYIYIYIYIYIQLYPIVSRVQLFHSYTTYIKMKNNFNTCRTIKATFHLSSKTQSLGRAVSSHAPCTCKIVSLDRVN